MIFFYMLVVKTGTGNHDIDFIPYNIGDSSVFIMRPGQVHSLVLKAESTGYLIQFSNEFFLSNDKASNQLLRKVSSINHYKLNPERFQKVVNLLIYILQEHTDKQERYQEVTKAYLQICFIELTREHSRNPSDNINLYMQERLEEFTELIEIHMFSHKQVSQYADMLNVSPYQLNAITKATLGKTSSEYINDHIILEAKRQLLATANQVNQVAYHLGYNDVSYFVRFFKKQTGYSPEAFRLNFR